jgi:hypothetical protein
VLVRGAVAGIEAESWANVDGSWGNSGGPICRVVDGRPIVSGIVLGRGGETNEDLDDLRRRASGVLGELEQLGELIRADIESARDADPRLASDVGWEAFQVRGMVEIATLLDQHFRTGFLRYADAVAIRKLL